MSIEIQENKIKAIDTNNDKTLSTEELISSFNKNPISYNEHQAFLKNSKTAQNEIKDALENSGYKIEKGAFEVLHELAENNQLPHKQKSQTVIKHI